MASSTKAPDETQCDELRGKRSACASPAGNLTAVDHWLASIPVTAATGWRWRRRGWIEVVNICGRIYITRAEIERFERRAAAGEFSRIHKTPNRPEAAKGWAKRNG